MKGRLEEHPLFRIMLVLAVIMYSFYAAIIAVGSGVGLVRADGVVESSSPGFVKQDGLIFSRDVVGTIVTYHYSYDGVSYTGDQCYDHESPVRWFGRLRRLLYYSDLGEGDRVDVWLDPDEPSHAFLMRDFDDMLFVLSVIAFGCLFVASDARRYFVADRYRSRDQPDLD